MSAKNVSYRKEDHVAIVSIDVLPKDQIEMALLASTLSDLCSEFRLDREIRVIILTGSRDDSFSMGVTLSEGALRGNVESRIGPSGIAEPLADLNRPTIAGIRGEVTGQGLELALACDIRVSSEGSNFSLPHIKGGLIPWNGGTQRLSRVVGKAKAMEMILTGERIDAEEAYRIGLVNKVVSLDELMPVALDMAHEMASKGPIALGYAKEAVYKGMDLTLEQGLRLEADLYFLLHTTRDRTEGIRAFQQKRSPQFKAR